MSSLDWHAWTQAFLVDPAARLSEEAHGPGGRDAMLAELVDQLTPVPRILELVPARNIVIVSLAWPTHNATWFLSFDREGRVTNWTDATREGASG